MEIVVAVAIGVLATIFIVALVALIVILRRKICCRKKDLITQAYQETKHDRHLVTAMEGGSENTDLELDDVRITPPHWENMLRNETWVDDATGLVPHCIDIMKVCHILAEKLVAITMGQAQKIKSPETVFDIIVVAKRIGPRVDDVITAMYPPLDPKLLEARCTALVLSVSHLALVTKNACHLKGVTDWIDQYLSEAEEHLEVLRVASREEGTRLEFPDEEPRGAQYSPYVAEGCNPAL